MAVATHRHPGERGIAPRPPLARRLLTPVYAVRRTSEALPSAEPGSTECELTESAVSGHTPPAGPQWTRELPALDQKPLAVEKALCVSQDGFTLHANTRAGAADTEGREALLRYILRPPIAQERVTLRDDGLVRLTLKRAYRWTWIPSRCCVVSQPPCHRRVTTS